MSLQRVHHIVVRVKDLDQGIASYEAMGLKLDRRAESAALSLKQAFFKLDDGSYIEVCTPTDPAFLATMAREVEWRRRLHALPQRSVASRVGFLLRAAARTSFHSPAATPHAESRDREIL